MVKILKKPFFTIGTPTTKFVVGELPRNYSVPPVNFPGSSVSSYLSDDCNTVITLDTVHPYWTVPPFSIVVRNPFCVIPENRIPSPPLSNPNKNTTTTETYPPSCASPDIAIEISTSQVRYNDGLASIESYNYVNFFFSLISVDIEIVDLIEQVKITLKSGITQRAQRFNGDTAFPPVDGESQISYYLYPGCALDTRNNSLVHESGNGHYQIANAFVSGFWTGVTIGEENVLNRFPDLLSRIVTFNFTNERTKNTVLREVKTVVVNNIYRSYQATITSSGQDIFGNFWIYSNQQYQDVQENRRDTFLFCMGKGGPTPPPPPREPPMSCCPNVRENDALLKLILKRIGDPLTVNIRDYDEKTKGYQPYNEQQVTLFNAIRINTNRAEVINDIVGISEYPITAPKSIVEDYRLQFPEEIDDLWGIYDDEAQPIQLANLTQFLNWQVEQESAVMGGWHQLIRYEKDGKTETVRLINIAETLKELIIIQAGQNKDNSLIVDLLLRVLTDLISIKSNVIRSNYIVEDIQDYLDYPTKEKKVDFPISITTPEKGLDFVENESIKRVLKPSIVSTTYQDWTGKNSLHDKLLDLLQGAAAIRGAFTESGEELINISRGGDAKEPDAFQDWTNSLGE